MDQVFRFIIIIGLVWFLLSNMFKPGRDITELKTMQTMKKIIRRK